MLDFFEISGYTPASIKSMKIIDNGLISASSHIFIILTKISSWSCVLLTCNDLIILIITLLSKLIELSLPLGLKEILLIICYYLLWVNWNMILKLRLITSIAFLHCDAKKLLKFLTLILKSYSSIPSFKSGCIIGILLPLYNVLRAEQ